MKYTPLIIASGLLMGITFAAAPTPMEAREKLETGDVAAFDAAKDKLYAKEGTGVMARVVAAEVVEKGSGNAEMVKIYMEDKLTPAGAVAIQWGQVPKTDRMTAIQHIVAKETLDKGDLKAAVDIAMKDGNQPELVARQDEILGLMPKSSIERYKVAHQLFNENKRGGRWELFMKDQDILDALGGMIKASQYDAFRKEMMARCIGAVTRTRRAAKLPNDSKSFDEAMAPILAALNAPLWDGLPSAVAPYGMTLMAPDYTKLVEDLTNQCGDLEERKVSDASGFAGSLMFWKGVEGYKSWAQQYTED